MMKIIKVIWDSEYIYGNVLALSLQEIEITSVFTVTDMPSIIDIIIV